MGEKMKYSNYDIYNRLIKSEEMKNNYKRMQKFFLN